jgi:DeoR family suf operon transcriptional repressor
MLDQVVRLSPSVTRWRHPSEPVDGTSKHPRLPLNKEILSQPPGREYDGTVASPLSPSLSSLPSTRRTLLLLLKKRGEAGAAELAEALGVTVSAARQHLAGLTAAGLVTHRPQPSGPGRPPLRYSLDTAGEALFPRFYGELTNELLEYVEDADPALVDRVFERRRRRRVEQARKRVNGKSFPDRVAELTAILDEDGYLAEFTARPDGTFLVTEYNCAILGVAQRHALACSTEIEFLRAALPDARIERVAHRMAGAHVCSYEIRRTRGPARAKGANLKEGSGAGRRTRATGSGG